MGIPNANTDKKISIHAPREGGDLVVNTVDGLKGDFNPRPPRGGRHSVPMTSTGYVRRDISIHAPREGGDYILQIVNTA